MKRKEGNVTAHTLAFLAALVVGAVLLILLVKSEQYRAAAQIGCAAIKAEVERKGAAAENLQHALEICQENGIIRLPGD